MTPPPQTSRHLTPWEVVFLLHALSVAKCAALKGCYVVTPSHGGLICNSHYVKSPKFRGLQRMLENVWWFLIVCFKKQILHGLGWTGESKQLYFHWGLGRILVLPPFMWMEHQLAEKLGALSFPWKKCGMNWVWGTHWVGILKCTWVWKDVLHCCVEEFSMYFDQRMLLDSSFFWSTCLSLEKIQYVYIHEL